MNLLSKIFFICFSFCTFISCSYLQIIREKPKAKIVSILPDGVTPFAIKFRSEIEVENPYTFSIEINKINFKFTSENKKLVEGNSN
ncbi:MAG TPA: hypothetical protein VIG33_04835, partial [Pseudobdellovibrionaceae bacterium]